LREGYCARASFSASRELTIFVTSAAGSGLSTLKRIVVPSTLYGSSSLAN
jgi:hypothetical protein